MVQLINIGRKRQIQLLGGESEGKASGNVMARSTLQTAGVMPGLRALSQIGLRDCEGFVQTLWTKKFSVSASRVPFISNPIHIRSCLYQQPCFQSAGC